jgi:hypothetical protein
VNGKASGDGDWHGSTEDPWIKSVGNVAAPLLAGFSLASVITVTAAADQFRWPGGVILLLTIAAVALIGAVQSARRGARDYIPTWGRHRPEVWRRLTWAAYHLGVTALLGGLGLALVPQHGVGMEENLRRVASGIALAAGVAELLLFIGVVWRRWRSPDVAADPRNR